MARVLMLLKRLSCVVGTAVEPGLWLNPASTHSGDQPFPSGVSSTLSKFS
jgi:hypothetical protein